MLDVRGDAAFEVAVSGQHGGRRFEVVRRLMASEMPGQQRSGVADAASAQPKPTQYGIPAGVETVHGAPPRSNNSRPWHGVPGASDGLHPRAWGRSPLRAAALRATKPAATIMDGSVAVGAARSPPRWPRPRFRRRDRALLSVATCHRAPRRVRSSLVRSAHTAWKHVLRLAQPDAVVRSGRTGDAPGHDRRRGPAPRTSAYVRLGVVRVEMRRQTALLALA